jgi:hypothetical protein
MVPSMLELIFSYILHKIYQGYDSLFLYCISQAKGIGYLAWKWIRISLESWMVSWYKNEIAQASVSNCMHQCLNVLVLNAHIPKYLGSRGKPFFLNS